MTFVSVRLPETGNFQGGPGTFVGPGPVCLPCFNRQKCRENIKHLGLRYIILQYLFLTRQIRSDQINANTKVPFVAEF